MAQENDGVRAWNHVPNDMRRNWNLEERLRVREEEAVIAP